MDKNNGRLDPKQREHLAQMLKEAKTSEQVRLRNEQDVSADSILRDLAGKSGALDLVTKVEELENLKDAAIKELATLGFEFSYSHNLRLTSDAPGRLSKEYGRRVVEAEASIEKSVRKYDLAVIGVWTADTAAQAKKIVEGLI
jgi:hypothetical protein